MLYKKGGLKIYRPIIIEKIINCERIVCIKKELDDVITKLSNAIWKFMVNTELTLNFGHFIAKELNVRGFV